MTLQEFSKGIPEGLLDELLDGFLQDWSLQGCLHANRVCTIAGQNHFWDKIPSLEVGTVLILYVSFQICKETSWSRIRLCIEQWIAFMKYRTEIIGSSSSLLCTHFVQGVQ